MDEMKTTTVVVCDIRNHMNDKNILNICFQRPTKYKMAISLDSKKYFERYRSRSLVGVEALPVEREDSEVDNGTDEYPEES